MQNLLKDYLDTHTPSDFRPMPIYSKEGDSLTFIFENIPYYRERIDDFLTVYRALPLGNTSGDRHLIGCQIKGLPSTLELLGDFDLTISNQPIKLTMLFLACMATSENTDVKHLYLDLAKHDEAKKATIRPEELAAA